jgi:Leucine-rich repeat (LRR) protein
MLSTEDDKYFFTVNTVTYEKTGEPARYFNRNTVEVFEKKIGGGDLAKDIYKKKYNVYFCSNDNTKIFNIKFKEPVHNLSILGNNLKEIKSLPKGLMSLWLQGIPKGYKMSLKIVPKTIVSIFYRWTDYTLGEDLTSLKKLKVFGVPGNHMIFSVPKFPKGIEYIDLSDCQIGRFDDHGLLNFNLKDYPNIKYVNFSGNYIKKIPAEWKKKSEVKIIYNKQRK